MSSPGPNAVDCIIRKRNGDKLSPEDIRGLVRGMMAGNVADYQMSAWLMASWLRGLDEDETVALTHAMLESGRVMSWQKVARPTVDKHSTGGVGDKISLCLAPLVACCGASVPMVAGRGLGHTGGTLDKLESIEGYRVNLSARRFGTIVRTVGASIIGQTKDIAPADGKLYALRDVTGTVESIPLIVASILSKKLAEGIDALVLDVKAGSGAFMKTADDALALARALVRVGRGANLRVSALVTPMNTPTGTMIGNALEAREAIAVLQGQGPSDTTALTLRLAEEMLRGAGVARTRKQAHTLVVGALRSGAAFECFRKMVHAHGGNLSCIDTPARLPHTKIQLPVEADTSGYVTRCDAFLLGRLAMMMGAGRARSHDRIDHAVGIELCAKPGTQVTRGDPLCLLHVRTRRAAEAYTLSARKAFTIGSQPAPGEPEFLHRIG